MSPPSNSSVGIFSTWVQVSTHIFNSPFFPFQAKTFFYADNYPPLFDLVAGIKLNYDGSLQFQFVLPPIAAVVTTDVQSSPGTIVPNSRQWRHILASWDISGGSFVGSLYLDDVLVPLTINSFNSGVVAWSSLTRRRIFAWGYDSINFGRFDGVMANLYLNTQEYLDFSITSNRRKFISGTNEYVDLGVGGELPTGNFPSYYFKGDPSHSAYNRGTDNYGLWGWSSEFNSYGPYKGLEEPPGL